MTIDGWNCEELYPGTDWRTRTASRRNVEFCADSDGITITESSLGYQGGPGSYVIPPNVLMWLVGVVR